MNDAPFNDDAINHEEITMANISWTTPSAVNVRENLKAVTAVMATTDGTAPLSYSIVSGNDAAKFVIGASTGVVAFVAAPDFETPTDANADNVYELTVEANDGAGSSSQQSMTVTVANMDDALEKIEALASQVALDIANVQLAANALETDKADQTALDLATQSITSLQTGFTALTAKVDVPDGATVMGKINDAVLELENKLKAGVAPEYDTFLEIANEFASNADLVAAVQSVGAGSVRFNLRQSLATAQKEQARWNIGAASHDELQDYKAEMGNPATFDPMGKYTTAKTAAMNP